MFPALGLLSAGFTVAGGILQSAEYKRIAAERIRQMRLIADQKLGEYTAGAAASGVEMTSSTVQNTLARMRAQFEQAVANVETTASVASRNTLFSSFGQAFGSFGQNLYNASKVTAAFGEKPEVPPVTLDVPGTRLWDWQTGQDFNMLEGGR